MHCPGVKHGQTIKRICRYLNSTRPLGLYYPKRESLLSDLHAFFYSDWACFYDTRVSTSVFCFMLGSSCISWLSRKQTSVATSICEAEYRATFTSTIECVWLRRLLAYLGVGQSFATTIFTDSQSASAVVRNPVFHTRTKHIEVNYHYVKEWFINGEIGLAYGAREHCRPFHEGSAQGEVRCFLQSFRPTSVCGLIFVHIAWHFHNHECQLLVHRITPRGTC